MARIWEEREPLLTDHDHHLHVEFGDHRHHHHHDESFHHAYATETIVKRSVSESSEATAIVQSWTPPAGIQSHPPPFEVTDNELEQYTPVWVPNPESADERDVRPRTLVLCFDGTGDQFDDDVSVSGSTSSDNLTHRDTLFTYRTPTLSNSSPVSRKMTRRDNSSTTKPASVQLQHPTSSLQ